MAERAEAREVLAHLNQLGYTQISAQQLKEFLKGTMARQSALGLIQWVSDLKKVIKYEERLQAPQAARAAPPRLISVRVETRPPRHEHCAHSSEPPTTTSSSSRRPCGAKRQINRCDPVALYHFYQAEWKKARIPGQEARCRAPRGCGPR